MESLARLLAVAMGRDPNDPDFGYHDLEARITLNGLVRVLRDEDLTEEIARRLCEHKYGVWEEQAPTIRNECIFQALGVLDALRDLITEELYPGGG